MKAKIRRLLLCLLALALLCLSAAPFALLASHRGHFRMSCSCPVCTAIRSDLAVLHLVAAAVVLFIAFRVPFARLREDAARAETGHRAPLPVALKVRLND